MFALRDYLHGSWRLFAQEMAVGGGSLPVIFLWETHAEKKTQAQMCNIFPVKHDCGLKVHETVFAKRSYETFLIGVTVF